MSLSSCSILFLCLFSICCPTAARVPAQHPSGGLSLGLVCSPHSNHAGGENIQPCTGYECMYVRLRYTVQLYYETNKVSMYGCVS